MLDGGLSVNSKTPEGITLLMLSANELENGMTPLLWASLIDHGNYGSIETLVKAGADVRARTKAGETALALVKKWHLPEAPRVLQQVGAPE